MSDLNRKPGTGRDYTVEIALGCMIGVAVLLGLLTWHASISVH
jgi:hypothetical protein